MLNAGFWVILRCSSFWFVLRLVLDLLRHGRLEFFCLCSLEGSALSRSAGCVSQQLATGNATISAFLGFARGTEKGGTMEVRGTTIIESRRVSRRWRTKVDEGGEKKKGQREDVAQA